MKITISMPTSKVKLQGLLWHLNKLYLIATTGKEHMTFKMSKRYIGGHQLGRFCNSFLPNLWEPERWPYPLPLQPEFCSTSLMGVWYSLRLYCTGLCNTEGFFLKNSHSDLWNARIRKCLNSPGKETVSGKEAVWSLHFLCCKCIISPRPKAWLLFC